MAEARIKEHQALDKDREAAEAAAKAKEATDAAEITAKEVIAAEDKAEKVGKAAEAQSKKTQEEAGRYKGPEKPKGMHQHSSEPEVDTHEDADGDSLATIKSMKASHNLKQVLEDIIRKGEKNKQRLEA